MRRSMGSTRRRRPLGHVRFDLGGSATAGRPDNAQSQRQPIQRPPVDGRRARSRGSTRAGQTADRRQLATQCGRSVRPPWHPDIVAKFVYIDETGSSGRAAARQPHLTVAAAIVDETMVQRLREGLRDVAWKHLKWVPADLEFHGQEIWNGTGYWAGKTYDELIAAYEAAMQMLDICDIAIAYASIHKARLHHRYHGAADDNAYRLALQFLLEKVDTYSSSLKILVADETKEQQIPALKMVQGMQNWTWGGEVPGRQLKTIIDTLHFVSSHDSAGVQMADLVAFVLQRRRRPERHPNAQAAIDRLSSLVDAHTRTWREPWP